MIHSQRSTPGPQHIKQEVFVWNQTKHPNLYPLLGYRSQPAPRLISPWSRHGSIKDYLTANPELSLLNKLRLIYQAACGLDYLHSQDPPICHSAVKPESLLINDRLEAALSDFVLSRVLTRLGVASGYTVSAAFTETLHYTAGEILTGEKPNLETDVYAFGGLILTVMSEKPPFSGLTPARIVQLAVGGQMPEPEDHPKLPPSDPLWSLMRRCWNKAPAERPTMHEVLHEVRRVCEENSRSSDSRTA
ncbi:hypothetical protein M407DRAFT_231354 [Tulasnella calospora MUT 4182]|uniref:Protein kinase domain-containing protein n=1 Tax=Tulasnella calospora MUT 4182 TaxID=1051891 RepID=A0A0C3QMJ7_9AGAM|nr:hypothetical protein M407DRAFT_231354 [Tulasnella calospora MUT 4182]